MFKPKIFRKLEAKFSWWTNRGSRLRRRLISEGKTRWLDLGSSSHSDDFYCFNLQPIEEIPEHFRARYYHGDILKMTQETYCRMGRFDLVRMQHVFEHFSLEESQCVLEACSNLLNPGGYLLISVPDLVVHIQSYLDGYKLMRPFVDFARVRIPKGAPASFLFGLHVHQGGYAAKINLGDAHNWLYDYDGLRF